MTIEYTAAFEGLGIDVRDQKLTAAEALAAAGLDWTVRLEPAYRKDVNTGEFVEMVPPAFAVVRNGDEFQTGRVGAKYEPVQNDEAFTFADNLVGDAGAKYIRVFETHNGRRVYALMEFPEDVQIGGEDAHKYYGLLSTSHDGSKAVRFDVITLRIRCKNMMNRALRTAKASWSVPHVRNATQRVAEAQRSLGLTTQYIKAWQQEAELMIARPVDEEKVLDALEFALPQRPSTSDVVETIMGKYRHSEVNGYKGTAWGAFNAFTEYFDHGRERVQRHSAFTTSVAGHIATQRNNFADALMR